MQIIEISPFQAFRRSVATVMQVVPKELRYVTILTLLGGSSPAIAFMTLAKVRLFGMGKIFVGVARRRHRSR
ncbi:hypothetical protein [Nostoc sp.]|uniref:hypothetical protein n=1 Tax=Nostoc sp. TaxID=1180 RepID=UPI002FF94CCD